MKNVIHFNVFLGIIRHYKATSEFSIIFTMENTKALKSAISGLFDIIFRYFGAKPV